MLDEEDDHFDGDEAEEVHGDLDLRTGVGAGQELHDSCALEDLLCHQHVEVEEEEDDDVELLGEEVAEDLVDDDRRLVVPSLAGNQQVGDRGQQHVYERQAQRWDEPSYVREPAGFINKPNPDDLFLSDDQVDGSPAGAHEDEVNGEGDGSSRVQLALLAVGAFLNFLLYSVLLYHVGDLVADGGLEVQAGVAVRNGPGNAVEHLLGKALRAFLQEERLDPAYSVLAYKLVETDDDAHCEEEQEGEAVA